MKAKIFDIQSFSVNDGPGCRTNIFFSGCPLRCKWCANPESWGTKKQLMFSLKTCKWKDGCKECENACDKNAIIFDEKGKINIDRKKCVKCNDINCAKFCTNNVLKQCLKEYTVDEILKIVIRDSNSWGVDGGVTFTGGEPLLQHEALIDLIKKCKKKYIHTVIETSAYVDEEIFLEVLSLIDFAFVDIKNIDDEKHIMGTGVSNKQILSNVRRLKNSDWEGRLIIRQPIIPNFNDSDDQAKKLIEFLLSINQYEINLLKFHKMGATKWTQLGKKYLYNNVNTTKEELMYHLQELYINNGIACYIGNDTEF